MRCDRARLTMILGSLACAGCAAAHMREVRPAMPIRASAGAATVVFVRPHVVPAAVHYVVLDAQGRAVTFLGESAPSSHFVVTVPPGQHDFVAFGNGGDDVATATLAPGRIYFIEVATAPFSGVRLVPVHRAADQAERLHRWLDETTQLAPDRLGGQADLTHDPERVDETMRDAMEKLRAFDPEEREKRTLAVDDGVP